jgi:dipeptidyl aminopeptidase/acylaminoacyl peptidase
MTTPTRLERSLPSILGDLAAGPIPDYIDDVLVQTARKRQRPGWTFPERWLPMADITSRRTFVPRIPFRAIGVALVIVALLLAAIAVYVGSNQRLPAPFGVAANGVIAFADSTGAILTADPSTGTSSVIVAGSGHERPTFSPDGTRLAFVQANGTGAFDVVVTDPLGRDPRTITTEPIASIDLLTWSPDGTSVVAFVPSGQVLFFDASRTAPPRVLTGSGGTPVEIRLDSTGLHAQILFRPPTGNEILSVARSGANLGLSAVHVDGTGSRTIIDAATAGPTIASLEVPEWSPDGTRIVVSISAIGEGDHRKLWIVNADGTGLRLLTHGQDGRDEGHLQWSPDGTKVAFMRWIDGTGGGVNVRPITVVDIATGAEREIGDVSMNGFNGWTWSPDGQAILMVPEASKRILLLPVDPLAQPHTLPYWISAGAPSWQRTASD